MDGNQKTRNQNNEEKSSGQASSVQITTFSQSSFSERVKYVKLGYHYLICNALYFIVVPIFVIILTHLSKFSVEDFIHPSQNFRFGYVTTWLLLLSVSIVFLVTFYIMKRERKVYLVNFACYKPEKTQMISRQLFMHLSDKQGCFSEESLNFQSRVLERSGFGESTYIPAALMQVPVKQTMGEARKETESVMFGAIDEVLAKTGVKPRDIGILVVNSGCFNPTPSLSAAVVNRYKLRSNILNYNLGGMGCSAGIISIDLAKHLLQVHRNSYALVVSTENITSNWYAGNNRTMLVTNCLFRLGGAAILLSNRSSDRRHSKYELVHTVRTHKGEDDKSYKCVFQQEDELNKVGFSLSKNLMAIAGEALKANIKTLGPLVLPLSEQLLFFTALVIRKLFKMKMKPYVPDFKLAFEHFCIHAGGRGVLDEIEKNLNLTQSHMEPSRMTLYRFGNTSSSSVWYELAYLEAKGRMRKGDRVWQIGFGSGFKCNSAVWHALRRINPNMGQNPWKDEIDEFPVEVLY